MSSRSSYNWQRINTSLRAISAKVEYLAVDCETLEGRSVADIKEVTYAVCAGLFDLIVGVKPIDWPGTAGFFLYKDSEKATSFILCEATDTCDGHKCVRFCGESEAFNTPEELPEPGIFYGPIKFLMDVPRSWAGPVLPEAKA